MARSRRFSTARTAIRRRTTGAASPFEAEAAVPVAPTSPSLTFILNGAPVEALIPAHRRLIDLLRREFGLIAAKEGCGDGTCGACAVLVDGEAMNACLYPAHEVEGRRVDTLEGLNLPELKRSPLQQAFLDHGAVGCGFCTPGRIMSAQALLHSDPDPDERTIAASLAGHRCECVDAHALIGAVQAAARGARSDPAPTAPVDARAADAVSGRLAFIQDLGVPGMLHGAIKYAKQVPARLRALDTSRAERLPGVRVVITARNAPPLALDEHARRWALVADLARCPGDAVAAVAATSPEVAREALDLLRVEYEALPAPLDEAPARRHEASALRTGGCLAQFDGEGNATVTTTAARLLEAQWPGESALRSLGLAGRRCRVLAVAGESPSDAIRSPQRELLALALAWRGSRPVLVLDDPVPDHAPPGT